MEASNVITAFVTSANQHALCQNEDDVKQFQRHLEILVCLTSEAANLTIFQNRTLVSSQCITHVVNVLMDNNTKLPLLTRSLAVLQNLATNSGLLKILQSTFYVHSAVSIFLQRYGMNTKDTLVIQCLQLLETVTYNIKIDYLENHFQNLIEILLKFMQSESSQILKSSLHILSNICRNNSKVQSYICNLPDMKQIVKKLSIIINTEVPNLILYALSIISSITPHNSHGAKLWTDEHLMLTFDLTMKLLICNDNNCATTALDLFEDLAKVSKYQSCLKKSPSLGRCLRKICKALHESPSSQCVLYLKFLYSLTNISEMHEHVSNILCMPRESVNGVQVSKFHPKLLEWCTEKSEVSTSVTTISLQLISGILALHSDSNFHCIEESATNVLKTILKNIPVLKTQNCSLEEYVKVKQVSFDLLLLLSKRTNLSNCISQNISLEGCEILINFLLNDCLEDNDNYNQVVDLFLTISETISILDNTLSNCNEFLGKLLQNNGIHCLAFALTSDNKDNINRSLSLISHSSGKCSFSSLSESLLKRNSQKNIIQNSDSGIFSTSNIILKTDMKNSTNKYKYNESSIDSLMNKIEDGLQIKDLKSSEIMDLYEHKIAILTLKEQELQNYVDAKTAALQEADRIITQYKCRQADIDAEALRLRSLMKDYECRYEMSAAQLNFEEQKGKHLESDLNQAYHKIKDLEQNINEQRELSQTQVNRLLEQKKTIEDEKVKLSDLVIIKDQEKKMLINQLQIKSKALEDLQESQEEITRMLEETKKAAEKFKSNSEQRQSQLQNTVASLEEKLENLTNELARTSEEFSHQIADLMSENEQLTEQIKLKDLKIEDMNTTLKNMNESLNEKNYIIQNNEISLSNLRVTLEQIEEQRTKLKQDKGMLELLCKKYEASIEQKDSEIHSMSSELEILRKESEESINDKENQIKHLKGELEKHKYITEMIHNMTSKGLTPKS